MYLFDSSILIAGLISSHPRHAESLRMIEAVSQKKIQGGVCVHTLAECCATLTSYPIYPLISPEKADFLIQKEILSRFDIVSLALSDYSAAIKRVKDRRLRSGAVYDALIYQAAVKKKAKAIYTWDTEDFSRLADPNIQILNPG